MNRLAVVLLCWAIPALSQNPFPLLGVGRPVSTTPPSSITCCSSVGSGNAISGSSIATGTAGTAFSCASGNTEVAFVYDGGSTGGTFSVADSAANSGWASYGAKVTGASPYQYQVFVNFNIASSVTSVTASFTGTPSFYGVSTVCLSGTSHTDFAQVTASGGFNATITGANYTTTQATEISLSFIGMSGMATVTSGTGYTAFAAGIQPSIDGVAGMYQIFSSTQSGVHASGTSSSSVNWQIITVGLY